jgi:hypothetical protein
MALKVGDIRTHRLTGKRMKVIQLPIDEDGIVCRCEQIDEPQEWVSGTKTMRHPIAVCSIENLTEDQSQLPLFQV